MNIQFKNVSLKLEEILKDETLEAQLSETEKIVVSLIKRWHSGQDYFTFKTSGSTGNAKTINLARDKIIYSTKATFKQIDPHSTIKTALLCLSPAFIGGAMVVFRAIIMQHDLTVIEPAASIVESIEVNASFDLVSLVPLQYQALSESDINQFKNILIGGASMPVTSLSGMNSKVYSSYGMTETVSHVALRLLDTTIFTTTGDAKVALTDAGTLAFKGTITDHQWLVTNDLGVIHSDCQFEWLGRADFVINSGGVKINPERIEQLLSSQISSDFMIASLPDKKLGSKVVLLLAGEEDPNFDLLDKYERPKRVFRNAEIIKTANGKIDRIATQKRFLADL